jgi:putative chitobiose transport system permease protein
MSNAISEEGNFRLADHWWRYLVMVSLLIVFIGPFLWLFSIAIRGTGNIYTLELIPEGATLTNFTATWNEFGFGRAFLNSLLVSAGTVAANIFLCSLAAYPLARMTFPGSRIVFLLILSTLMIPFQLYMIPLFLLSLRLGLYDTLLGIIVPSSVGAFGIYLLKQYYHSIPNALEEAARIDGASEFQIWWRVMFPLTQPAVAALGLFIFIGSWSSFLWPLIIVYSPTNETLPIAVARLSGAFVDKTQYLAAGSVIAVAPIIVLFFLLQRHFLGGLSLGAVKE